MKLWAIAGILTGLAAISLVVKKRPPKPAPVEKDPPPEHDRYDNEDLIIADQ